jgi:hypothetical protein
MRIQDPGWKEFGSGIRDGEKSHPGSRIRKNIPDPQHCIIGNIFTRRSLFKHATNNTKVTFFLTKNNNILPGLSACGT